MEFTPEVQAAIIYGLGTAVGGSFVLWSTVWIYYKKKKQIITPLLASNILISFKTLNNIMLIVAKIFKNTSADRFLLLFAHNGETTLRFANVALEQHNHGKNVDAMFSVEASNQYTLFEFDDEYRKMLKHIEVNNHIELDVSKMIECDLKKIYESEKVKYSNIYFLHRIKNYDNKKNDILLYCSLAKHEGTGYTDKENWFAKHEIDKIKRELLSLTNKYTNYSIEDKN